jgi:hypothetical protein
MIFNKIPAIQALRRFVLANRSDLALDRDTVSSAAGGVANSCSILVPLAEPEMQAPAEAVKSLSQAKPTGS